MGRGTTPQVDIEPVPERERTPRKRFRVIVEGSIISHHATRSKARQRAREVMGRHGDHRRAVAERAVEVAKVGSPVDATLDTMNEEGVDRFAAASGGKRRREPDEEPEDHHRARQFSAPPGFHFFSGVSEDNDGSEHRVAGGGSDSEDNDGNDLVFDDPLGLGGSGGD